MLIYVFGKLKSAENIIDTKHFLRKLFRVNTPPPRIIFNILIRMI